MGFHLWNTGDELKAADVNAYLANQVVAVFADATSRDANITSPITGMICYTDDTDTHWRYYASWVPWRTAYKAGAALPSQVVLDVPDSPLSGSSPPSSATPLKPYAILAGTTTGTTNSAGYAAFTLSASFPNGLLSVVANPTNGGSVDFCMVKVDTGAYATNHFYAYCLDHNGSPLGSVTVRLNYIAIGW